MAFALGVAGLREGGFVEALAGGVLLVWKRRRAFVEASRPLRSGLRARLARASSGSGHAAFVEAFASESL